MISIRDLLSNFYPPHSQISLNILAISFRHYIWIWVRIALHFLGEPCPISGGKTV